MSIEIDWSKAPDWATHYNSGNDMFYKVEDGEVYCEGCGGWSVSMHDVYSFVKHREVIPRPNKQEWEGWLPESGTVCEYQLKHDEPHDEWSKCVIEFVGDHHVVAKCWPDETMPELEQCFKKREVKFRPLKSKKDRQREELTRVIRESDESAFSFRPDDIADAILTRYNLEPKP